MTLKDAIINKIAIANLKSAMDLKNRCFIYIFKLDIDRV